MLTAHSNAMLAELHRKERRHGWLCTRDAVPSPHRLLELQLRGNERVQSLLSEQHDEQPRASAPPQPPPPRSDLETISRTLWSTPGGYIQPALRYTSTTAGSIGKFDEEELQFLHVRTLSCAVNNTACAQAHGSGSTQHHHRRDEFSAIAEHTLRAPCLQKVSGR